MEQDDLSRWTCMNWADRAHKPFKWSEIDTGEDESALPLVVHMSIGSSDGTNGISTGTPSIPLGFAALDLYTRRDPSTSQRGQAHAGEMAWHTALCIFDDRSAFTNEIQHIATEELITLLATTENEYENESQRPKSEATLAEQRAWHGTDARLWSQSLVKAWQGRTDWGCHIRQLDSETVARNVAYALSGSYQVPYNGS